MGALGISCYVYSGTILRSCVYRVRFPGTVVNVVFSQGLCAQCGLPADWGMPMGPQLLGNAKNKDLPMASCGPCSGSIVVRLGRPTLAC